MFVYHFTVKALREYFKNCLGCGGLVVERQTPEREVGVRSSLRLLCCILEQDTFTSQKVLVIPRKWWLCPDMTEKLLTGT